MFSGFQSNAFQTGFQIKRAVATTATTATGGKGDNDGGKESRKRTIFKPTGLLDRVARKPDGIPEVEARIQETHEIASEVQKQALRQFTEEPDYDIQLSAMSQLSAMDLEIGQLLRKKLRTDEEEAMLLILLALS